MNFAHLGVATALILTLAACAAPMASSPVAKAALPVDAGASVDRVLAQCREDGTLATENAPVPTASGQWLVAPDRRSVLLHGSTASSETASLVSCRSGDHRVVELRRGDFRGPRFDDSRVAPGLYQMSWFQFTPDGSRLVFAITAHTAGGGETLISEFIVVDVATAEWFAIDSREYGFNAYSLSDAYIVFWGHDAVFRADLEGGAVARLTPEAMQTKWTPHLSPDGAWVTQIRRDDALLLTSVVVIETELVWPAEEGARVSPFTWFSRDSSRLVFVTNKSARGEAGPQTQQVHLYDLATKREALLLEAQNATMVLANVAPDNRQVLVLAAWSSGARLFCVDVDSGAITEAPEEVAYSNLYVDEEWTSANIGVTPGAGVVVPIECAQWTAVEGRSVWGEGPPKASPTGLQELAPGLGPETPSRALGE